MPLPLVVVEPERVAVGALEFGVDIDKTLNVILSERNFPDAFQRVSEIVLIDNCTLSRIQGMDILTPDGYADEAGLKPEIRFFPLRDDGIHASGDGLAMSFGGKRYLKLERASFLSFSMLDR